MAEGLPVITDPDFITLDRIAQERAAQAALLSAGEDPTDPQLVDQVIEKSRQHSIFAPKIKRGSGGTLYRFKAATNATDAQIAQALGISRQAVNAYWHTDGTGRQLTKRDADILIQQLLLQRRRIDHVIEELQQLVGRG